MKRVVAFVPIKLNSQRLANKNILPINNRPMCWHIFESLLNVPTINETYVFCSDEAVRQHIPEKATFLKRNSELDKDEVKGFQIYSSFIDMVDADIYILAHTTSPFLKSATISSALDKMLNEGYDSSFSVQKVQTFAWYDGKPLNYDPNDVPRTQDIAPVYIETSGFYMFEKDVFCKHKRRIGFNPYVQELDVLEAIDIDTKEDFDFALKMLKA